MSARICSQPECQSTAGCQCDRRYPVIFTNPSPRFLPVNLPFSSFGVTIAIMDTDGNVSIKVDQPHPDSDKR